MAESGGRSWSPAGICRMGNSQRVVRKLLSKLENPLRTAPPSPPHCIATCGTPGWVEGGAQCPLGMTMKAVWVLFLGSRVNLQGGGGPKAGRQCVPIFFSSTLFFPLGSCFSHHYFVLQGPLLFVSSSLFLSSIFPSSLGDISRHERLC